MSKHTRFTPKTTYHFFAAIAMILSDAIGILDACSSNLNEFSASKWIFFINFTP